MNIKNKILLESGLMTRKDYLITEMAAKELNMVLKMIHGGDIDGAAAKYIEVGGSPNSAGLSKTINSHIAKHPDLTEKEKENLAAFRAKVVKTAQKEGIETRPSSYKTGTTGKTKEGEVTHVSGQSQMIRKNRINDLLGKQLAEIQGEKKILNTDNSEALKKLAKDILDDIKHEKEFEEDKDKIAVLDAFVKTGERKEEAVAAMGEVLDSGEKVVKSLGEFLSGPVRKNLTQKQQDWLNSVYEKVGVKKAEIKAEKEKNVPPEVKKKKEEDELPPKPEYKEPEGDVSDADAERYWPGTSKEDENKYKEHETIGTGTAYASDKFKDLSAFKNLATGIEKIRKGSAKKGRAKKERM